ncbi:MAG: capsule assembly Wzi family protein [Calditrichaeota bacterium]|nr:capsule assembly Wzi family protein [Calditrichota bacterium]
MINKDLSPSISRRIRMSILTLFILLMSIATLPLSAQETLPPYHWVYHYLDYLKVRGFLPDLNYSDRPFSRQQIARALVTIQAEAMALTPRERQMVRILLEEFRNEIQMLAVAEPEKWQQLIRELLETFRWELFPETITPELKLGGFGELSGIQSRTQKSQFRLHTLVALNWRNRIFLLNNSRIFNRPDSTYIGKKFRNIYAYTEQGYLNFQNDWLQAKIGRDFLQIGPGRSGQLLISDNSRPFDMYYFRLGTRMVHFSYWGIQLNPRGNTTPQTRTLAPYANRFLNGHRLQFNFKNKVYLGVSEVILYGGPNENWELGYMNPFALYYAHTVNNVGLAANSFFDFDWDIYLIPNVEIYGEFLVDDFQIDKKDPGDLEPNELGLILGANWASPFQINGAQLHLEYVQIRNRTYNAPINDWEKYLHRNRVIGYYLGNNFERFLLNAYYWIRPDLRLQLLTYYTRQGEGSVQGEFNKDYLQYTVEEGYSEPFPYGVVENHLEVGFAVFYNPFPFTTITLEVTRDQFRNYLHRPGNRFNDTTIRLNVWVEWDHTFRVKEKNAQ